VASPFLLVGRPLRGECRLPRTGNWPLGTLPIRACIVGAVREPPLLVIRMPFTPEIHHRHSIRLRGYDYSQPGRYYVTICTRNKERLLGEIIEGEMHRNGLGDYVALCWEWLPRQYTCVDLDEWIVMPNHLHGIIVIACGGGSRTAPTTPLANRKPLGRLVGAFKTVSTAHFNQARGTPGAVLWQRDFYDHIIRNEDELNIIREYIRTNPLRWGSDPENV